MPIAFEQAAKMRRGGDSQLVWLSKFSPVWINPSSRVENSLGAGVSVVGRAADADFAAPHHVATVAPVRADLRCSRLRRSALS